MNEKTIQSRNGEMWVIWKGGRIGKEKGKGTKKSILCKNTKQRGAGVATKERDTRGENKTPKQHQISLGCQLPKRQPSVLTDSFETLKSREGSDKGGGTVSGRKKK